MSATNSSSVDQMVLKTVMASLVQVIAVLLLLYWCFTILSPFLSIIIWGLFIGAVILALAYELLIAWMAPDEAKAEIAGS